MNAIANITPNKGELIYTYSPLKNLKLKDQMSYQDLNSKKFNFDLNHPVEMEASFSYDGSTDLILTDDKNIPRLVNSRFKLLENGKYEIPYRLGVKPENIYDEEHFELATSLLKTSTTIPRIKLKNVIHPGNLKVGNYVFYIKYADGDGNESDFVAESSIISCFIGSNKRPKTIHGGYRDLNSNKSIILEISNLDLSYNTLIIYYSRTTSDVNQNRVTQYFKLSEPKQYGSTTSRFRITGDEVVEEVPIEELIELFIMIDKAKTLAQCLNMLFFGNIESPVDDVKELTDISLRFLPYLNIEQTSSTIGNISTKDYSNTSSVKEGFEYYNIHNIYNKVGYWNEEFYRFGVVYIYSNGHLSNVYNIRGIRELPLNTSDYQSFPFYNGTSNDVRNFIPYNELDYKVNDSNSENMCGVFRINCGDSTCNIIRSVGIAFDEQAKQYLEEKLNIKGFFFVRQKRIPTILALTVILNMTGGKTPLVNVPVLPIKGESYVERFTDDKGTLLHDYDKHLLKLNSISYNSFAGLCPEYNLNQPYYNLLFTGDTLTTKRIGTSSFIQDERHYYQSAIQSSSSDYSPKKVLGIPDNTATMGIDKTSYKGIAGTDVEAFRVGYVGNKANIDYKEWKPLKSTRKLAKNKTKYIRGIYGPYLGIKGNSLKVGDVLNIYIPNYDIKDIRDYIILRCQDDSAFFAISDRFELSKLNVNNNILSENDTPIILYRGDCYFTTYTHRLNRNFQDSASPLNSTIVDNETWRKYFNTDPKHIDVLANINRSDVNAVQLGSWFTFKVCCSENLNLRAIDQTYPDEKALTGHYRSFYPIKAMNTHSDWAIPESFVLNRGFGSTVGEQSHDYISGIKYLNNDYSNRIVYSNIKVSQDYANSYRVFEAPCYRDYDMEKGSITKLIEYEGVLYCIFEHGIAIVKVNQTEQIGSNTEIFLRSNKVLPEKLKFIDHKYGSQWKDSIIKVDSGRVYGVDTVAKKIWMIAGEEVKIISDLVVGEFLNENIPLKEHELEICVGTQNVKTHYNAFKGDVMFTFYANDTVWNLCYNDILQEFITFYSWVPLESQNINNEFYSFDQLSLFGYFKHNQQYNNKLYKHGFGGIINNQDKIKPCYWYDEQHPFEFEVIVNDTPQAHKIFDNLRLLSNKAKPESFHYEIIGECFDFAPDKLNAYYRLEAKKEMWSLNNSTIMTYDKNYTDLKDYLQQRPKSVDFPLYYTIEKRNSFYTDYAVLLEGSKDYLYLSGTELVNYSKLNEIRMWNHVPGIDFKDSGRLRGNMLYLEDFWNVQINPIVLVEKNEEKWNVPPITLFNAPAPKDLPGTILTKVPANNTYPIDMYRWDSRKEIKLKDKWMKVRIRYSGRDLAMISALYTMYAISYA